MPHTIHHQKELLSRVKRIQGQLGALEKALVESNDCNKVLQQIAAIRGATNGLMLEVLDGHIREHLGCNEIPAKQKKDDLEQVLRVLHSYLK